MLIKQAAKMMCMNSYLELGQVCMQSNCGSTLLFCTVSLVLSGHLNSEKRETVGLWERCIHKNVCVLYCWLAFHRSWCIVVVYKVIDHTYPQAEKLICHYSATRKWAKQWKYEKQSTLECGNSLPEKYALCPRPLDFLRQSQAKKYHSLSHNEEQIR